MAIAALVLEYLKALLSAAPVAGVVALVLLFRFREEVGALIGRIIKLPGGTEFSPPQQARGPERDAGATEPPALPPDAAPAVPEGLHLTPDQARSVAELFNAERAKAYLWEYRFLNYYLVPNTQRVLDWLAGLQERTTFEMFDAWWLPIIPSAGERRAIINALQRHYLVVIRDGELMEVTPKGREYIAWRGPLPALPSAGTAAG